VAQFVSVQSSGGLATIRLDRPPVNALSIALQGELRDAAEQVSADPEIRAAVIYGGEKVFAAGADVTEMAARTYAEMAAISRRLHASFRAVAAIGKPVVAAITGFALGGGLELALCADFRVAGENARFGVPEILLGVIPGLGGTQRLPRLIGPARAKNLIYTGRFADAEEALRIGLVDQVVPDAEVYGAAAMGWASQRTAVCRRRWFPRRVETSQPLLSGATRRTYSLASRPSAVSAGPSVSGPAESTIASQCAPSSVVSWRPSAVAMTVVSPRVAMPSGATYSHSRPSSSAPQ